MILKIRKVITSGLLLFLIFFLVSCASNRNNQVYYDYDHGYHTVLKNETLYAIAFQHGLDHKKIARWNGIRSPYTIYAGQRLKLSPSGVTSKTYQAKKKSNKKTATTSKKSADTKPAIKKNKPAAKPIKHDWNWPTKGVVIRTYSSNSGGNKGIDIGGKVGQAVVAASSVKSYTAETVWRVYGNLIIIKHSEQFLSAYAHNKTLFVKEGGMVKRGDKIAELGKTGTIRSKVAF